MDHTTVKPACILVPKIITGVFLASVAWRSSQSGRARKPNARAKRRRGAEGKNAFFLPFRPLPSLCSRARFLALPD